MSEPLRFVNEKNITMALVAIYHISPWQAIEWAQQILRDMDSPQYAGQIMPLLERLLTVYETHKRHVPQLVRES